MKLFFVDLETTGTDRDKHGIHQISGAIVIDGKLMEEFDYHVAPGPSALIDPVALRVCNVTFEQINNYPPMQEVFLLVSIMIHTYINIDDPNDRFFIVGYNSQKFDSGHLAKWFQVNGKLNVFKNAFWLGSTLDVMILATAALADKRYLLPDVKQSTIARFLGIDVDEDKLHTSDYDIYLCRAIYHAVYGKY